MKTLKLTRVVYDDEIIKAERNRARVQRSTSGYIWLELWAAETCVIRLSVWKEPST